MELKNGIIIKHQVLVEDLDEPHHSDMKVVTHNTTGDTNSAILGSSRMRKDHQYRVSVTACTVVGCHSQPSQRGQTVNGMIIPRRKSGKAKNELWYLKEDMINSYHIILAY